MQSVTEKGMSLGRTVSSFAMNARVEVNVLFTIAVDTRNRNLKKIAKRANSTC